MSRHEKITAALAVLFLALAVLLPASAQDLTEDTDIPPLSQKLWNDHHVYFDPRSAVAEIQGLEVEIFK